MLKGRVLPTLFFPGLPLRCFPSSFFEVLATHRLFSRSCHNEFNNLQLQKRKQLILLWLKMTRRALVAMRSPYR